MVTVVEKADSVSTLDSHHESVEEVAGLCWIDDCSVHLERSVSVIMAYFDLLAETVWFLLLLLLPLL